MPPTLVAPRQVVKAIKWAWDGYARCAWGDDEVAPQTCAPLHWFRLGLTIVDSLDTLMLAGLTEARATLRCDLASRMHTL